MDSSKRNFVLNNLLDLRVTFFLTMFSNLIKLCMDSSKLLEISMKN